MEKEGSFAAFGKGIEEYWSSSSQIVVMDFLLAGQLTLLFSSFHKAQPAKSWLTGCNL